MADSMTTEDKISHFLKLAEDAGATQAERDTAAAQAERLMLKHGIDRLTALAADRNTDEKITTDSMFFGGAYGDARMRAANQVLVTLGLKAYKSAAREVDGTNSHASRVVAGFRLTVVGFESDLADAMRMIRSLDLQSAVAVKAWARTQKNAWWAYSPADKTRAKQAFALAFGIGAAARIKTEREEAVADAGAGTALVLVDRAHKVAAHFDTLGMRRGRATSRRWDGSGWSAGRSAGYNANTGGRASITAQRAIGR